MNEKHLKNLQYLKQMKLKEAIKTCLEAGVSIEKYTQMTDCVWLPKELFLRWFRTDFTVRENDGALKLLVAYKEGVVYKCWHLKGE